MFCNENFPRSDLPVHLCHCANRPLRCFVPQCSFSTVDLYDLQKHIAEWHKDLALDPLEKLLFASTGALQYIARNFYNILL